MATVLRTTTPIPGGATTLDPWSETAFTRFESCFGEEISDGCNRLPTTKDASFDVCEAVEAVAELFSPEIFERFAMRRSQHREAIGTERYLFRVPTLGQRRHGDHATSMPFEIALKLAKAPPARHGDAAESRAGGGSGPGSGGRGAVSAAQAAAIIASVIAHRRSAPASSQAQGRTCSHRWLVSSARRAMSQSSQ